MRETWHMNTEFTIETMDRVKRMTDEGWRPGDIAFSLDISEARTVALLQRNGLPVHARRKRK